MPSSDYAESISALLQRIEAELTHSPALAELKKITALPAPAEGEDLPRQEKLAALSPKQQERVRFWLKNLYCCAHSLAQVGEELDPRGVNVPQSTANAACLAPQLSDGSCPRRSGAAHFPASDPATAAAHVNQRTAECPAN